MRIRAGIIGAAALGAAWSAGAQTSPYSSMAIPGEHNGWDASTPGMTLVANNLWIGTQTLSSASGYFKFAANGSWTTNWGGTSEGSVTVVRVPAEAAAAVQGGGNLRYTGFTPGDYRFTFNDSTKAFLIEWVDAPPLPLPGVTNLYVVGDFNGWAPGPASALTNSPANTNLWSGSLALDMATGFQFYLNDSWANQFGAPETTTLVVPGVGVPLTNNACGAFNYTLSGFVPGTFYFALDVSNNLFTVVQTATQEVVVSTITVQGNFIGTNQPVPNMVREGDTPVWTSDHFITNASPFRLRFAANGGVAYWGATNGTPNYALPVSGTMVAGQTNFAQVTIAGLTPGLYRISFNHLTGEFTFQRAYTEASGINLLVNPGFEQGTLESGLAPYWESSWQGWPKAATNGYSPHSGSWLGAIHGKYENEPWWNDFGSLAQDVAVEGGLTYQLSAWFKATPTWTPESMQMKMEWRDAEGASAGGDDALNLPALTTSWAKYTLEGVAPPNAVTCHVVFLCSGATNTFATMHVDDAEMRTVSGRTQDFDTWGTLTTFGEYSPDWSVTSGKAVLNVAPERPLAAVLISQYVEGTGNNKAIEIYNGLLTSVDLAAGNYVLQQYDNGSTNVSTNVYLTGTLAPGACLVVGRPEGPPAYAPDVAISGLPNLLTNQALTFNGDDVVVLRSGGPTGTVLDRVGQVGTNATSSLWSRSARNRTLSRRQTVFTGTVGSVSAPFPFDEWISSASDDFAGLGSHDISWLDPNQPYTPAGYSLVLNTNAVLMSGELVGGIGDVSFWYCTESASPAVAVSVESGPSAAGPWTTNIAIADLVSTNFAYYVTPINRADHTYLRIRQIAGATNRFRIDEIYVSEPTAVRRLEDFNGWTDPAYQIPGTYSRYGWSIENAFIAPTSGVLATPAARMSPPDSRIVSPAFEGGVGEVRFWAKTYDVGDTGYLRLQVALDGSNFVNREVFTVTTAKTHVAWLYVTNVGAVARLVFNESMDSGDVLVDNLEIRVPALYRNQNFDSWPTRSGYVTENYQGWFITNCIVDPQNAYQGQVARLRDVVGNYVLSPELPSGIGTISFRTRKWGAGDAAFTLQVQVSPNGVGWTTLSNVSAASTNYEQITIYLNDETNRFVRFFHSAGNVRVLIDDIRVPAPSPRPEVLVSPSLDPSNPIEDEPMTVVADVVPRYGATILSVTGYYKIGPFGSEFPLSMSPAEATFYQSDTNIPGQSAGKMIRYRVAVQYAGIGAATNSTTYTTNTHLSPTFTNYVGTVPLGSVWINEIYYAPYDEEWEQDHEYVELCGQAGVDVSGWKIQFLFGSSGDVAKNTNTALYASYTIPTNTVFTNAIPGLSNGFSFYVLGDQQLSSNQPVDQILTTYVPTNVWLTSVADRDHIYDGQSGVGVVRLLNQFGNLVYSLSYNGFAPNSERIPFTQPFFGGTNGIGRVGSNYVYEGFSWGMGDLTIGAINNGQILVDPPPDTNVYAFAWHDQGLQVVPVDTNNVPPFHMLDPERAGHFNDIQIYFGYTNADYPNAGGILYHREGGIDAVWTPLPMDIRDGSADAAGHAYAFGTIPAYEYRRLQEIEYFIQVEPNESGVDPVYLGSDDGGFNVSTIYPDFADAEENPFTYLVPIADPIAVTNFRITSTSLVFQTDGNDPIDPLENFSIRTSTNLLTPTPDWQTHTAPPFTAVSNIYGQWTFTIPQAPTNLPKLYYRINPLWP